MMVLCKMHLQQFGIAFNCLRDMSSWQGGFHGHGLWNSNDFLMFWINRENQDGRFKLATVTRLNIYYDPQENQTRVLIPTRYAQGYVGRAPVSRGRPTSASQHPGSVRPARARPTSARTDPMPRYAPPPGRTSSPSKMGVAPSLPVRKFCKAD